MSIQINKEQCTGCLKCAAVCPGNLIKEQDGKAFMKYPKDCWGCVSCVKECAFGAIDFYLGADIGGTGGKMKVSKKGEILSWKIAKREGTVLSVDINSKDSNRY